MKIWLDDIRTPPTTYWHWCRSVNEAKELIETNEKIFRNSGGKVHFIVELISLDHDLGDYAHLGGDGIALMDWMVERGTLFPVEFHTMNPVGRESMERMYRRYWLGDTL